MIDPVAIVAAEYAPAWDIERGTFCVGPDIWEDTTHWLLAVGARRHRGRRLASSSQARRAPNDRH